MRLPRCPLLAVLLVAGACAPDPTSPSLLSEPAFTGQGSGIPGAPGTLAYSNSRAVYRAGRAIETNVATLSSGSGVSYSVAPALPEGLALDAATGSIQGTPLAATPTNRYVVTAANLQGTTRFALYLTVLEFAQALEPAQRGEASSVRLLGASWGRLVDVFDRDPVTGAGWLRARNLVVGETIGSNAERIVETMPATGLERVTILQPFGSPGFAAQYDLLESSLVPIAESPLGAPPPTPVVPRNAVLVLRFDDLIDPATVSPATVELATGTPATSAFVARVFPDRNHGNVADRNGDRVLEFHSTRVIVDLATSELELASTAQAIAPAPFGLPPATDASTPNAVLRLATQTNLAVGQTQILRNLSGSALSFTQSGPSDPGSPSLDVVRAFRSGGPSAQTGDPYDGFVLDLAPPRLLGTQSITIGTASIVGSPVGDEWLLTFTHATAACAQGCSMGDLVRVGASRLELLEARPVDGAGTVSAVRARRLAGPVPAPGAGTIVRAFDPVGDAARAACYVSFEPPPAVLPATGVSPNARVVATFSEPIDGASLDALEAVYLTSAPAAAQASDVVVARAESDATARALRVVPVFPLTHAVGGESYRVHVAGGALAVRDAAGNTFGDLVLPVTFTLPATPTGVVSRGVAFRFGSNDELTGIGGDDSGLGAGRPEWRGAFSYEIGRAIARPRPVTRFSASADRVHPVPALMAPYTTGTRAPLSPYGCRLQTLWRYCDLGMSLLDEANFDVDVEGLSWAPRNGVVAADHYSRFEMRLAHSRFLPDESIDPGTLLLNWPLSGLGTFFVANEVNALAFPSVLVHPAPGGPTGYTVQAADAFVGPTGTTLVPWPMNRGVAPADRRYYTWRDTSIPTKGVPGDAPGAELTIVSQVSAPGSVTAASPFPGFIPGLTNQVPTIGLPLLMDFRCFPEASATGLNVFDVSIASTTWSWPNFRAFSIGGVGVSGNVVGVDPETTAVATGGPNPDASLPGFPSQPADNLFSIGQVDLVVRVSRMTSIWVDLGIVPAAYAPPVLLTDLPPGTSVEVAFRGAVTVASTDLLTDSNSISPYGDRAFGVTGVLPTFLGGLPIWRPDLTALAGGRFVQARVSMVANAATGAVPGIDGLGIAARN